MAGPSIYVPGIGKARLKLHSLLGFLFTTFAVFYFFLDSISMSSISRVIQLESWIKIQGKSSQANRCDLLSGRWVYDDKSHPLYGEQECSVMPEDFACGTFGRKEFKYQKWRWQPRDCDLPRFNAKALLEKLRGKRLIFVGDSLNRNQWVSLVCMLESSIPPSLRYNTTEGNFLTFKALEYNATVEFYWAPLLLESNSDRPNPLDHQVQHRIIRVGAIEKHATHWTDADILVFNSYIWWLKDEMTLLWGSFESPADGVFKKVDKRLPRFEMALRTWSFWLENNINQTKTRLFFMSLSPFHPNAEAWGATAGGNCYGETEPIQKEGYKGIDTDGSMMRVAETEVDGLKLKGLNVEYLNITQLSYYRKDAHISIHKKHFRKLTKEQLSDPKSYADCVHWCVPGVPDVWNQILYTHIMYR